MEEECKTCETLRLLILWVIQNPTMLQFLDKEKLELPKESKMT